MSNKLNQMLRLNKTRINYLTKFQELIDEYNAGSINVEEFFRRLCLFSVELNDEEQRGLAEGLREEELVLFDLFTKPNLKLSAKEEKQVKAMAHDLLEKLKAGKLVLDWKKQQRTQATVRLCIEEVLDALPAAYTDDQYREKCEILFQHFYDCYARSDSSVYTAE